MSDSLPTPAQAAKACNVPIDAIDEIRIDTAGPADRQVRVTLRTGSQVYLAKPKPAPKPKAKSKGD